MWRFLIILCAIFCPSSADIIPEIQIDIFMDKGDLRCVGTAPPLVLNELYQVYVKYTGNIYRSSCSLSQQHDEIVIKHFLKETNRAGYLSKDNIITRLGEWKYECQFYTKHCIDGKTNNICYFQEGNNTQYQDKGINCHFMVHVVKMEEIANRPLTGYLTANGKNFSSLDRRHDYYFYDGEPVDFVCHKTTGGFVQLSYSIKGVTSISTDLQSTKSVVLFMKLSAADNDNADLKCTITDETQRYENAIQLHLIHKAKNNHEKLGFVVNGLILPRIKQNGNMEYYFEYKYYPGELLEVEVVKDQLYGDVTCDVSGQNVPYKLSQYFNGTAKRIENLSTTFYQGQTNTSLICSSKLKYQEGSDNITITFIYYTPDYSPFIEGLSMANILMKYTNSTANVIQYSYIGNETLNLSCFTQLKNKNTEWIYSQQALITPEKLDYIENRKFQLASNRNEALITCSVESPTSDRTTHLKLIRRKEVETTTRIPTTPATNKGPVQTPSQKHTERSAATTKSNKTNQELAAHKTPAELPLSPTTKSPIRVVEFSSTSKVETVESKTKSPADHNPNAGRLHQEHKRGETTSNNTGTIQKVTVTYKKNPSKPTQRQINASGSPSSVPGRSTAITEIGQAIQEPVTSNPDTGTMFWIIAAAAVVTIVVVVALSCILVDLRKRKRRHQNNPVDIDYQNLPRHSEGPMQTPEQWNSENDAKYDYAVPNTRNVDDLYSKPVPKRLRPEVSDHNGHNANNSEYTNASVNEPTYASVQNGEPTYASVQKNHQEPKHAEIGEVYENLGRKPTVENDITYAEIYNKNDGKPFVSNSKHPVYGQLMHKAPVEQKYANLEELNRKLPKTSGHSYENVNARKEEIEPTYCEVNVKK